MRHKKLESIICPTCGMEYLPAEIYNPSAFFGKPKCIIRDDNNKIEHIIGNSIDCREQYICDNCDKPFSVIAKISFVSKVEDDFSDEHESIIGSTLNFNEE